MSLWIAMYMCGRDEGGARVTHEDIYNFLGKFVDYVYHFILFDNIFVLAILFEFFFILLLTKINYLTLKHNTKPWFSRHN